MMIAEDRIAEKKSPLSWLLPGMGAWLAAVIVSSRAGWLGLISPYAIPAIAGALIVLPAVLFWRLDSVRALIEEVGLRRLTVLHIFRIAAVPLFFWYGSRGLLPKAFVEHAGWGDLISGLLALAVVAFWSRPGGYWLAHVVGMADFLYAFATAMMLTRANAGAMHAVTELPAALIPFFFVGLLGSTHLMAYSILLRSRTERSRSGKLRSGFAEVN